jgi:putative ABC transport system permease protein
MFPHRPGGTPFGPFLSRLLQALLRLYPPSFRDEFREQWIQFLIEQRGEQRYRILILGSLRFWLDVIADSLLGAARARREERDRAGSARRKNRGSMIETLLQDLRMAHRTLSRRPLFAGVAVLTLGLGIGAATAMFSVVDGVLLADSPYREPDRVMSVWQRLEGRPGYTAAGETRLTFPQYEGLAEETTVFEGVAVYAADWGETTLTGGPRPELVNVGAATASLLPVLGVGPVLGRWFLPDEEGRGAGGRAMVTVLSYEHWAERYAADTELLGRDVILNGRPFTVVGILPPGFRMQWMSASLIRAADPGPRDYWVPIGSPEWMPYPGSSMWEAVGRLVPGLDPEAALAETTRILNDSWPGHPSTALIIPRVSDERRGISSPLLLLFGATGVLLLIACGNVAALSLGELQGRVHEVATRSAIGARGTRIFRQLMTESLILGIVGSTVGALLALGGTRALVALAPPTPRMEFVGVDLKVLGFSGFTGTLSGILFGAVPALVVARRAAAPILKSVGRAGTRKRGVWGRAVLVGEIGLTVLLLVCAGLMARSLTGLMSSELGFQPEHLASIEVGLSRNRHGDEASAAAFMDRVLREISEIPGVEGVSATNALPFPGRTAGWATRLHPNDTSFLMPQGFHVSPGYLEFLNIPIMEGRGFLPSDGVDAPPVAVVGESLARTLWGDRSPVGQQMIYPAGPVTVVGVAGDVRQATLDQEPPLTFYTPFSQLRRSTLVFLARSPLPETELIPRMRDALWEVDDEVAVTRSGAVASFVHESAREERFRTFLMGTFAVLATILAVVGIVGGTARQVARRTREVGIRKALGAEDGKLLAGAVGEAVGTGAMGIAIGLAGAFMMAPVLAAFLFGVESFDLFTYSGVAVLLLVACGLAGYLPARRILAVDPVTVLREE